MSSSDNGNTGRRHRKLRRLRWVLAIVAVVLLVGVGGGAGYVYLHEHLDRSGRVFVKNASGASVQLTGAAREATPVASPPLHERRVLAAIAGGSSAHPTGLGDAPKASPSRVRSTPTATPTAQKRSGREDGLKTSSPTAVASSAQQAQKRSERAAENVARMAPNPGVAAPQPPVRIEIPRIEVDAKVVLANNEHLPKFPGIGWYLGSAFPGRVGNMVMFGHLDGPDETLGRLSELRPGDGIYVMTHEAVYVYTVHSTSVVSRFKTSVMAPTDDSRLTLITCAGTWLPKEGTYTDRLVVVAQFAKKVDLDKLKSV